MWLPVVDVGVARYRRARRRRRFWGEARAALLAVAFLSLIPATLLGGGTTVLAGYGAWKAHRRVRLHARTVWELAGP